MTAPRGSTVVRGRAVVVNTRVPEADVMKVAAAVVLAMVLVVAAVVGVVAVVADVVAVILKTASARAGVADVVALPVVLSMVLTAVVVVGVAVVVVVLEFERVAAVRVGSATRFPGDGRRRGSVFAFVSLAGQNTVSALQPPAS